MGSAAGNPAVDLTDTVERVARRATLFAKNRGISFDVVAPDAALMARCNPIAAEQAITNLVETRLPTEIPAGTWRCCSNRRATLAFGWWSWTMAPASDRWSCLRLGERTFRSDEARQRNPSGSGLGLAITANLLAVLLRARVPEGRAEGPSGHHRGACHRSRCAVVTLWLT